MLGIPVELYTAMFAVARIVGWSAHRIEEMICTDKIIRPAYMSVMEEKDSVRELSNQDFRWCNNKIMRQHIHKIKEQQTSWGCSFEHPFAV